MQQQRERSKKYLSAPTVRQRYDNISDMTLWRWIHLTDFPKPEYINKRRYWDAAVLDHWDATRGVRSLVDAVS